MAKNKFKDITIPLNLLINEVNKCLNNKAKTRYFQNIALLYSFQENILKWLVFVKLIWDKSENELEKEEMNKMGTFADN